MNMLDGGRPVVAIQNGRRWWEFREPVHIIAAGTPAEVPGALAAIGQAVERDQLFAAGYVAYEAAGAYGYAVQEPPADGPPLLWFGLYEKPLDIPAPVSPGGYRIENLRASLELAGYQAAVERIKQAISAGYTYQANFTFQLRAEFSGDSLAFFSALVPAQQAGYAAYLDLGRFTICSVSPELFFRLDGDQIESRPMKGTAPRGRTSLEDRRQMAWLAESEKNRAENVMIVDMIRNDFGRIAATGSVNVPALFVVERYPTLLQMISTVTARTDAPLEDIFAAVFPCASITGAPKVRTMSILRDLESGPRGIYTGAIGYFAPGRQAQFNVAIRTAVIDRELGQLTYGVGSGVVWDSEAVAEYEECLLKAQVLSQNRDLPGDFRLLESIRWTPKDGFYLLDRHMRRLTDSADYFAFTLDTDRLLQKLERAVVGQNKPLKVRILAGSDGSVQVELSPLALNARSEPVRVGLATEPISSAQVWLYHKTTRREVYERARLSRPDCDDVILWNERGEVTESSTANVVVELDGNLYTSPVSTGLLAGTLRAALLEQGELCERVLFTDDLRQATGIWLINSVRGRQRAVLVEPVGRS